MIQGDDIKNYYKAEEGHTIIRKSDGFNMGRWIFLAPNDTIENYESISLQSISSQSHQAEQQNPQEIEVENFNKIDEIVVDDMIE